MNTRSIFFFALCACLLFAACTTNKQPEIQWNYNKTEVTGAASTNTDRLKVDIYLDVTTSMKGFVSAGATSYSNMLDDIEGMCQNVWKNTDIRYYKFGRSVAEIKRDEFVSAKTSPAIYSDPQLSTQTNFAEAVQNTDAKRVSILITDFFYNNNDVNLVVSAFKQCFQKGVDAGVASFASNFTGTVADVKPPVMVNGTRPVYVLIFGDKQNIGLFLTMLKNKPYFKQNQFLFITGKPTESFDVDVVKDKKATAIKKYATKEALKNYGTVYTFRMDEKEKDGAFTISAKLSPSANVFPYTEKNIKAITFKKTPGSKDSIPADNELKVTNVKLSGGVITATATLENTDKAGNISYVTYFVFDNTVTPLMPKWVKDQSTDVYSQGMNEDKTLNLEKLLTDITTNQLTYAQPKLAKFYINIEKK